MQQIQFISVLLVVQLKKLILKGFQGKELKFAAFETQKTVTVKAKSDSENDDNEYFWLNMYLNKTALENNESIVNNKAILRSYYSPYPI